MKVVSLLLMQAALEGALSTLANMAGQSSEAQQAARESGLLGILVGCLQQALNGALKKRPVSHPNCAECRLQYPS